MPLPKLRKVVIFKRKVAFYLAGVPDIILLLKVAVVLCVQCVFFGESGKMRNCQTSFPAGRRTTGTFGPGPFRRLHPPIESTKPL